MTWREYLLIREGYNMRRVRKMEHTRIIAYQIAASNRNPNTPFPTIQQYWSLPTDDDAIPNEEAEANRLQEVLDKYKRGEYGCKS